MNTTYSQTQQLCQKIKDRLKDKEQWQSVLLRFGVSETFLTKPNQPCPFCGGQDRSSFTNYNGHGGVYCRKCGYRDGFRFLMDWLHVDFPTVVRKLADLLGIPSDINPTENTISEVHKHEDACKQLWLKAKQLCATDGAARYLKSRGLKQPFPSSLRYLPRCRYCEQNSETSQWSESFHEALLCRVDDQHGKMINVLRIYLDDGRKAQVKVPKKVLGKNLSGGIVRLGRFNPAQGVLGIAEGVETALSAAAVFNVPVWSAVHAGNLKNFVPPLEVRHLIIFADADANFVGQREAYAAASAISAKRPKMKISVRIPYTINNDWNDILIKRLSKAQSSL